MFTSHINYTFRSETPRIKLQSERAVTESLAQKQAVLVCAPRRSGLTTMLTETAAQLKRGWLYETCYISGRELATSTAASGFAEMSARLIEVAPHMLVQEAMPEEGTLGFRRFLLRLLAVLPGQLLLVIDDLDTAATEWRTAWLNLLRGIINESNFQPLWRKLSCLMGANDWQKLYRLDPSSPLNYLPIIELGSATVTSLQAWLEQVRPGNELDPAAALALHAWSRGNPVICASVAANLPPSMRLGATALRETIQDSAVDYVLPSLSDNERSILEQLDYSGPLAYNASEEERLLLQRNLLRLANGRLHWSSPFLSQSWRNKQEKGRTEEEGLVLDIFRAEVRFNGRLLPLFPQEMRILFCLARKPGQVMSPASIYRQISEDPLGELGAVSIKTQIARLRRKLPSSEFILTRRGLGYYFNPRAAYRWLEE